MSIMDFLKSEEAQKFESTFEKIRTFMNDEDIKAFFEAYEEFEKKSSQKEVKQVKSGKRTGKKLTELYSDYTLDEIKVTCKRLNSKYQEILKKAYGENLTELLPRDDFTKEDRGLLGAAQTTLLKYLKNPNKIPRKRDQKLAELYSDYTIEEIKIAFEKLNPKYQEILKRAYGDNLDELLSRIDFTKEDRGLLGTAQTSLLNSLKNPNKIPRKRDQKLAELYSDYTIEEIKIAFEKLNPKYQEILTRIYGGNLNELLPIEDFTKEEKNLLIRARNQLTIFLQNPNRIPKFKSKKLIEMYPAYTIEQIRIAYKKLNPRHQEVLKRAYGENLTELLPRDDFTKEEKNLLIRARNQLTIFLQNPNKMPKYKSKKLIEMYPAYTIEQIRIAYKKLNPRHQEVLKRAYGDNLDELLSRVDFTKEDRGLLGAAQTTLLKYLKNPNKIPRKRDQKLAELYSDYTIEEIKIAFEKLNPKYQEILKRAYGNNLDELLSRADFTKEDRGLLGTAQTSLLNSLKKSNNVPKEGKQKNVPFEGKTLYEIFNDYTKDKVEKALTYLLSDERDIILIFFGGNYDNNGSYLYLPVNKHGELKNALGKLKKSLEKLVVEESQGIFSSIEKTSNGMYKLRRFSLISFYEKYNCNKVQVVYFYKDLEPEQKILLRKVCGKTLEETDNFVLLTSNELQKLKSTLNELKKMLLANLKSKNPIEKKIRLTPIYEKFSDYSKDTIDRAISRIDSKIMNRFKNFYNGNLNRECVIFASQGDYKFLCNVFGMIESKLKVSTKNTRNISRKRNVAMVIHEKDRKKIVVPSRSKILWFRGSVNLPDREAKELLKQLEDSDLELLKKAYGPYYSLILNNELTHEQLANIIRIFIDMKYLYASNHPATKFVASSKTLYEILGVSPLIVTKTVHQVLGESEIKLLKISFGEKLLSKRHNSILTTYEKKLVNKIISFLRREIEKQIMSQDEDEYKLVHRIN